MYYGNAWNFVFLPDVNGRTHFHRLTYPGDGTRFLLATAAWHAMSASCSLQMSVFGKGVFCPGYRHRAMATGDVGAFLEHARVQVAALTPWMMEDVARKPNAKEYIEKLDAVLFGGGECPRVSFFFFALFPRGADGAQLANENGRQLYCLLWLALFGPSTRTSK